MGPILIKSKERDHHQALPTVGHGSSSRSNLINQMKWQCIVFLFKYTTQTIHISKTNWKEEEDERVTGEFLREETTTTFIFDGRKSSEQMGRRWN